MTGNPGIAAGLDEARRLVRRGRAGRALRELTALGADLELIGLPSAEQVPILALMLECHLALGDLPQARLLGDRLTSCSDGHHAAQARHARAELAAALDRHDLAAELFLAAGDAEGDLVEPMLPWRSGAALSLVRTGRRREGVLLAHEHHDRALLTGTGHDLAGALRTLATVESDGRRTARLEEAFALLAFGEGDRLRAQLQADLAALLVLDGRVAEAIELLRAAEVFAGHESLWPLQSRVRRLLERLGETPRRLQDEALAALTVSERRVALLAVDGHGNRAIAEQLGVSVKAIEGHLSKVYRKLAITSRADLATIVSRRD